MAPVTADSSEDEGEGLNQEIPQLDRAAYNTLLIAVQKAGFNYFNIGMFLQALFTPPQRGSGNSQKHTQMVSAFFKGKQEVKAQELWNSCFQARTVHQNPSDLTTCSV